MNSKLPLPKSGYVNRIILVMLTATLWDPLFAAQTQNPATLAQQNNAMHWPVITAIAGFFILVTATVVYILHLRKNISSIQSHLARSAAEWSYAMDFLEDPMYLVDLDDNLVRANRAFFKQVGKTPEEALGRDVRSLIHLKPEKIPCPACAARLEKRDAFFTKEKDDPTNPTGRPIEVTVRVVRDEQGDPIGMLQGLRDLSHLRATEEALRQSRHRLANAQRIAKMGNWDWHVDSDEMLCSQEFFSIFALEPSKDPIKLDSFIQHLPDYEQQKFRSALSDAIFKGNAFSLDQHLYLADGSQRFVHQEAEISVDSNGKVQTISGTAQDITASKLAEQALYEEKEKAQVTLKSIGDAVLTTNIDGEIEYANPAALHLLQQALNTLLGKNYNDIIKVFDSTTQAPIPNPIGRCLFNDESTIQEEQCLIVTENDEHVVDITAAPIRGRHDQLRGCVLVMHDVTAMHSMARLLNYQATHDDLTNLINRREFEVRLSQALENAKIDQDSHSLLFMDLDNFKIVNDTCGHIAGDELLKQFSGLLQNTMRTTDTFARLGGDEFAVLLMGCPLEKAKKIGADIQNKVRGFRFQWNSRRFEIGVSVGISPISSENRDTTEIMSNADSACYAAKNLGKNQIHVYDDNDVVVQKHRGEMQWVNRINQALSNNQFELYCQEIRPIVSADDSSIHYEILIRMLDDNGKLVTPNVFIPAAERYNLMPTIDRWVIREAFQYLAKHNIKHEPLWRFSINLSGQSLSDNELLNYIRDQLNHFALQPEWICFEVTETAAITKLSDAKQLISSLRNLGFRFALDDFGSGMSSFTYLRELNVDFLKIDGSFVKRIADNRIDYAMVSSINQIGQLMGIQTIAEYVENDNTLTLLKDLQVDFGQGYGIDKPKPLPISANSLRKQAI